MDEKEGLVLIATTISIMITLFVAVVMIMLIYRKRGLEHSRQIELMHERFSREMLQAELEIQQLTMQEIGREIHDNVGQKLTLAALYAHQFGYEAQHTAGAERAGQIAGIIDESLNDLRGLSKSLTSDYIKQTGLVTLIRHECEKANAAGVCRLVFDSNVADIQASYTVKNMVVRIVQEFIQNSLKHAQCTLINVEMNRGEQGLQLHLYDDGKGFREELPANDATGIGLENIRKRAAVLGATLVIKSEQAKGTGMQLSIPTNKINA